MIEFQNAAIKILVTNEATVWGQHDVVAVMVQKRGTRAVMPDCRAYTMQVFCLRHVELRVLMQELAIQGMQAVVTRAKGGLDGKIIIEILPRRQRPLLQSIMSGRGLEIRDAISSSFLSTISAISPLISSRINELLAAISSW
jgi:hypothetical protein